MESIPSPPLPPPPPPPPLPPPPSFPRSSRPVAVVAPPPTPSPGPTISEETYATATDVDLRKKTDPFRPCYMFFYGSLMDAEVLQSVLDLPETPSVTQGEIKGFSMKMWGIYPTIIRTPEGTISGTVWKVDSEPHFQRLEEYETSVYTWWHCDVVLEDGRALKECRTFCWAGDVNSKELEEGTFDLSRYQKYFKSSVVRR
ncbi:hypothetical protein ONS95_011114 [Cadophora gregata]|uniref:uncharacterized protein n=1 Tax=Cadophora gregata TaxID=51156 RepID=UPI0026DC1CD2|nr:uncharacterized protein ONS95_011114 [Cadophora gregata]KAK0119678.1 hypothetical protein ONS95_011114 [Cadophora gregata]